MRHVHTAHTHVPDDGVCFLADEVQRSIVHTVLVHSGDTEPSAPQLGNARTLESEGQGWLVYHQLMRAPRIYPPDWGPAGVGLTASGYSE